ncbi:uncharacterized protein LOC119178330 [Rhipicephalus microplus]|uniref:uncharacterized protein LOC119178330 n=1 Tax=Rhipicephalus microplus TaxID=6941 RepID=UPI0018874C28|nr:uncharacterized protein LOC119178330 [Rhipicephalus microplus]
MKSTGAVLFLVVICAMTATTNKVTEKYESIDVVIDKEAHRIGAEAIKVGELLRAIALGLRTTQERQEQDDSQSQQYFFGKIFKAIGELGKGAVSIVQGAIDGIKNTAEALTFGDAKATTNAANILRKLVVKDLSLYAGEEGKTYKQFRQHFTEELSRVAESLFKKGEALCSCHGQMHLDRNEAKFVQLIVEAF